MLVPRSCQLNILQRQDLIDYVSSRFGVSCSPVSLRRCGTSGGTSAEEFVTQTAGNKKSNGATFALPFILSSSQRKEQHKYQQQQQQKTLQEANGEFVPASFTLRLPHHVQQPRYRTALRTTRFVRIIRESPPEGYSHTQFVSYNLSASGV